MAKTIERPKTKDVQEFWTKFPMTFGVTEDEVKKCGAEAVWVSTERTTLQKLVHLEDEKGRFLGSVIDWDWLTGKHALEIGYGTGWFTNMIAQ